MEDDQCQPDGSHKEREPAAKPRASGVESSRRIFFFFWNRLVEWNRRKYQTFFSLCGGGERWRFLANGQRMSWLCQVNDFRKMGRFIFSLWRVGGGPCVTLLSSNGPHDGHMWFACSRPSIIKIDESDDLNEEATEKCKCLVIHCHSAANKRREWVW